MKSKTKKSSILIPVIVTLVTICFICIVAIVVTSKDSKYGYNPFEFYFQDTGEVGVIAFDSKEYTCTKDEEDYILIKKNGDLVFKGTLDTEDGFNNWKNYDYLGVEITSKEVDNIGYHCIHYVIDEQTLEEYKESIESFKNGYTDEQLEEMGIVVDGSALDLDSIGGEQDIYLYYVEMRDKDAKTYFYFETLESDNHLEDFLNINFAIKDEE